MKRPLPAIPVPVVVGLILAVVLDTIIQITWKLAVASLPAGAPAGAVIRAVLANSYFYVAMAAFVAQLVNWMRVLARADLSFAQPFTALSYITVLAISAHVLHESLPFSRLLGVLLILLGVFFISRTPTSTAGGVPHGQVEG